MRDKSVAQERESWTSLFQPDVLAAAQYMTKWRNQRNPEPEKMLMYAVKTRSFVFKDFLRLQVRAGGPRLMTRKTG
jgi:hypothetical protein